MSFQCMKRYTSQNFRVFLLHLPLENLYWKWLWPLYRWKKICSDYRVHGIQIDRLRLTVSMQKSVLKYMHRVPRYHQKSVKNRPSKPNHQNLTHFGRYLRTQSIFFKTDFCVETVSPRRSIWIPNNPNNFFFTLKGSEPFCRPGERCSHKSEKF